MAFWKVIIPRVWKFPRTLWFEMERRKWENNTRLDGEVYLIVKETMPKGRDRAVTSTPSDQDFKPKMFASEDENCPVETYRVYRKCKPKPRQKCNQSQIRQLVHKPDRVSITSVGCSVKGNRGESWLGRKNVTVGQLVEDYHRLASIKHQEKMLRMLSENTTRNSTSRPSTSDTGINKMTT